MIQMDASAEVSDAGLLLTEDEDLLLAEDGTFLAQE